MRNIYFAFMGIMFLLGLIVCFENITLPSPGVLIFFTRTSGSMFSPLIFLLLIGFIAGLFAGLGLMADKKGKSREDDSDI